MNSKRITRANRGFAFIEIIIVLAVILFLSYKLLALYLKESPIDKENKKMLSEQGIDISSREAIIDKTRKNVEEYNLKVESQNKELENIK